MRLEEIIKGISTIQLLYLSDSYLRDFQAVTITIQPEGKNNAYLVLNRTTFHPKAGGQPSDTGFITSPNFRIEVKKAILVDGVVVHYGKIIEGKPGTTSNERVKGEIQWNPRYKYMKRHTAAHLLDHCLTTIIGKPVETTDSWLGDQCYIGYNGDAPTNDHLREAEVIANQMITRGGNVNIENVSQEELLKRAPNAPNIYRLPHLEEYRIVTIQGCNPIPCAGTHLRDLKEIGQFTAIRLEKLASSFRVYYDIK
ncbi:MAG: alanyl-tRNA synthetase [Thermoproteota archaeon]|nr:alanyl-tRNA synthetase [Thermoproteota archaeon]